LQQDSTPSFDTSPPPADRSSPSTAIVHTSHRQFSTALSTSWLLMTWLSGQHMTEGTTSLALRRLTHRSSKVTGWEQKARSKDCSLERKSLNSQLALRHLSTTSMSRMIWFSSLANCSSLPQRRRGPPPGSANGSI